MSGLELIHGPHAVLNLATGQVLDLGEATVDELAEARERLGELWHMRTTAAMMIDAELCQRADAALAAGEDFGHGQRFDVYVDRGGAASYDANALRAELLQRAREGELPITVQAVERAFAVQSYRLDLRLWASLCKRWPTLRDIGERHLTIKRRSTRVKRRDLIEATAEEVGT